MPNLTSENALLLDTLPVGILRDGEVVRKIVRKDAVRLFIPNSELVGVAS